MPPTSPALAATLLAVLHAACLPPIEVQAPAQMKQAEGQTAADFSVVDHREQPVSLAALTDNAIAVLVFYRGPW